MTGYLESKIGCMRQKDCYIFLLTFLYELFRHAGTLLYGAWSDSVYSGRSVIKHHAKFGSNWPVMAQSIVIC
jgi:hypothetical protein